MPPIPDQSGKNIVITGANTGIGRPTAIALARAGAFVVLAGRSAERHAEVIEAIGRERCTFVALDLGALESVRRAADAILALDLPIHTLINNAGLAGVRGQTADGFELTFGVNHLGPFLLTRLLLGNLRASPGARVVCVASRAHRGPRRIDWEAQTQRTRSATGIPEYGVSKLANVLFARELAGRLAGSAVTAYSLHPGVVATEIWRSIPAPLAGLAKLFMADVDRGAETTLHCATAAGIEAASGKYFARFAVAAESTAARDPALAAELWRRSSAWVGLPPEL